MADDVHVEMECALYTKTGQAACGDDVRFQTVEKENRYIAALSDGLGSGVKAHVLSTMTTTMALRFLRSAFYLRRTACYDMIISNQSTQPIVRPGKEDL